jgi:NAD(P)-dependent dehydrogenase (short-subunit alcohol dehydrogenase family)
MGAIGGLVLARLALPARRDSFRGHHAVITGGARGLGLALARRFAAEGARLSLISRSADDLQAARLDLQARGASVDVYVCDVRDQGDVDQTFAAIVERSGGVDVLVNNAGIIQFEPFAHATLGDFDDSLRTHFWGPLYCIRACLPHMKKQGGGRILNISSVGGRLAVPHLLPYCVGKFAATGLSEGLHAELAADNISVTTATPGLMRTGSHRNVVVRGRHRAEARWFGLLSATPLTSMNVERAARQIVEACRARRAQVTPNWQARVALRLHALMPEVTAAMLTAAALYALPRPADRPHGDRARYSAAMDLGWITRIFPSGAAARHNQRAARGEAGS